MWIPRFGALTCFLLAMFLSGSLDALADGLSNPGDNDLFIDRSSMQGRTENASDQANGTDSTNSTTISFQRWLKHFANPVVCNMIFCHSSCAEYGDACPSFRHNLLTILDDESCLSPGKQVLRMTAPAENCCVDNSGTTETFSGAGSPSK